MAKNRTRSGPTAAARTKGGRSAKAARPAAKSARHPIPPTHTASKAAIADWLPIRARLKATADPVLAEKYARIAPGCGSVLGITVPALREMAREVATTSELLTPTRVAGMADVAFASGCREEMLLAVFLLARFKKGLTTELWPRLDRWIDHLDNWEACDQLAMCVSGEMIARADEPARKRCLADLDAWTGAASPWRRRFALATTVVLNQKGRTDPGPALRICERLIADQDKSVQSAVAWAFREACKSDAGAVFSLLKRYSTAMPRTTLRQSAEKLSQAQRQALGLMSTGR